MSSRQPEFGSQLDLLLLGLPQAAIRIEHDGTIASANARARRLVGPRGVRAAGPPPSWLKPFVDRLVEQGGALPPRLVKLENGRTIRLSGVAAEPGILLLLDDVTRFLDRTDAQPAFVRNAAHQLRTPLTGIASAVQVLQAGAKEVPEERDRFLEHIARQTDRLSQLTRALLVLARAQSGEQQPQLGLVRVQPILEGVAESLPHGADVRIEATCPPGLAALAEPDLLTEALIALGENAVRHTRIGTVSLHARHGSDRLLEIEVADSGEGILPENLDRIFEPFVRSAYDGEGFGLGLAIAHQAVAAMGSDLQVESAPRRGTRFSFRLPAGKAIVE